MTKNRKNIQRFDFFQEVEAMCKRYSGFLRAAISDPQPERRWMRRGWVTFERNAKIKDICFSFNSARLRWGFHNSWWFLSRQSQTSPLIWAKIQFKSFGSIFLDRDCELGPIVNRDLSRRIRTVTGLTVDKKVVRNDIKLAAKIISNLDKRWDLWKADGDDVKVKRLKECTFRCQFSMKMFILIGNVLRGNNEHDQLESSVIKHYWLFSKFALK